MRSRDKVGEYVCGTLAILRLSKLCAIYGIEHESEHVRTPYAAIQKNPLRNGRALRHIVVVTQLTEPCSLAGYAENYTQLAAAAVPAAKHVADALADARVPSVADLFAEPLMAFPERQRTAVWSFKDDKGADVSLRWSADGTRASFDVWVAIRDEGRFECEARPHEDDCSCRVPVPVLHALTLHVSRLPKRSHDADARTSKRPARSLSNSKRH